MATDGDGRRSPPTERVVAVLDYLVAHKDRRFGLSELARELGLSKPTCLGILSALTEVGYLARDPAAKTYGLGPALITAGRAAQQGFALGPIAHRHLLPVAQRFGAACSASVVLGERITVLDVATPPGAVSAEMAGQAYPFAPPVGLMYVLWDGDAAIDAWLRREPTLPVRHDPDRLRAVVAQCRRDGYLVETLTATGRRLHRALAGVATHQLPPELRELLGEMFSSVGERVRLDDDADDGPISLVAAPTYDAAGRQAMVVTLHVGRGLEPAELSARTTALVGAARAITQELGGRLTTD